MIGKTTLYSEGRCRVSHQCVLLNVNATEFLYTGSTQMVSLQYELSYVRANKMIGKTTYCTGGRHVVSHQCVLLNVSANEMIGKRTSYTWGSYRVSHQCELSYAFSDSLTLQMILCIWYNLLISWYSALSNFVARCRNLLKTLCSARHQLLLLVCLKFGRFPSAPPVF
jgi:hypothetical protein